MGKVVADRTQAETQTPLILNPTTCDTYHDAATLGPKSLATAENVIFDDGIIEKIKGISARSSDTVSAAGGMGLHRTYANDGTKACLRLYNGTLKSGPSAFATTVLSNLATNKRTPWVDIKGKAYGVNETDGIIRYDAKTALGYKTGIVGPYLRKKIVFFESDEVWRATNGGSQVKTLARGDEWTGKSVQSLKLYCSALSTTGWSDYQVQVDLSKFSDDKASTNNDYITFDSFHDSWQNLDYIYIDFYTKGFNANHYYRSIVYKRDLTEGDNQWTHLNVRKGAFVSMAGTPDWSKVSGVGCFAVSNTGGSCNVFFDKMYLKAMPPKPYQMRKQLFNCEGTNQDGISETWTGRQAHTNVSAVEGYSSRYTYGTAAGAAVSAVCTIGTAIDLTKWPDGTSTQAGDEFVFNIAANDVTALNSTNPLILNVGSDASNYLTRTFTRLSALNMTGNNTWAEVRTSRARISATGAGTFAWTNTAWIKFTTSTFTGTAKKLYFDNCRFEPYNASYQIANMEVSEAVLSSASWTITGNGSKYVKDPNGRGWVTEGSTCLKLWGANTGKWAESSAILDFAASDIDLTVWADGSASSTDDYICINLFHQNYRNIEYVELHFDRNDLATFVDYYKYRITKDMFAEGGIKSFKGKEIRIQKKDFETVGVTGGWSTIGAVRVVVMSNAADVNGAVFLDNLIMRRRTGKSGRYYYKYNFKVDDVASALSESSDYIDIQGSKTSINLMTSQDSRVTSRDLYRLGGAYPETWMLVKTIPNNTDTITVDDVDDDKLTYPLSGEVPDGWVNSVLCNNLCYDQTNDQALFWGDPTYKNRVYYSHNTYYHVVDEAGYREFKDEVMSVVPWFGQLILFYKNGAQKIINGGIAGGELVDLPVKHGPCSYWATGRAMNGFIPYVGWDNVYIMDGVRETAIGDEVKNYFKGRESYLSTVAVADHKDAFYVACEAATGTPTYNSVVLRCYLPTKSWCVLPDWKVNMWSNWDKMDDQNDLYYVGSTTGNIYSINSDTYQFALGNYIGDVNSGWISNPMGEIRLVRMEFKAKGTASSSLYFYGYKDFSATPCSAGTITLSADWQTFTLGPKNIMNLMKGDHLRVRLTEPSQSAYFKIKDIVLYVELVSHRAITTTNEIAVVEYTPV